MKLQDHLDNEASLAEQLRAERLRSAGLEERIADLETRLARESGWRLNDRHASTLRIGALQRELAAWYAEIKDLNDHISRADAPSLRARIALLESTIAGLSAGFASKMATALEAMETRTAERIAERLRAEGKRIEDAGRDVVVARGYILAATDVESCAWRATPVPTTCSDLVAFVDGELPADRAEAFREHLQSCGTCATELPEAIMVSARLSELKR